MVVRMSPTTRVVLYPGEPKLFVNDLDGPVVKDLFRRMTRVKFESRKLVRVRTGRLFTSIDTRIGATGRGVYVAVVAGGKGIKYTGYEHDGTAPHEIRARRKKFLRFVMDGQVVFRRRVWHPGTTGTLFLTMALPYAAI
jgi:hypothetical protein